MTPKIISFLRTVTLAKRVFACSATRVLTGRTVTGPLRSASATIRSNARRSAGGLLPKCRLSGTFVQECQIFSVTKVWPHLGQAQSGFGFFTVVDFVVI